MVEVVLQIILKNKNSKLDLKNQDQPVTPAPMAEKAPDSLKSEPTDSPSSLPPPPPSIQ